LGLLWLEPRVDNGDLVALAYNGAKVRFQLTRDPLFNGAHADANLLMVLAKRNENHQYGCPAKNDNYRYLDQVELINWQV
jgi:hypothetical protein